MTDETMDLYSLQMQMRAGIEDLFPEKVWLKAEVASVQVKTNGHCYMDLCQSEGGKTVAKAKAVIWRSAYAPIAQYFREAAGGDIAPGMELMLRVRVSYSELYGLTLTVDEVEPQFTIGAAEMEKRRNIEKLTAEGLMDKQKGLEPVLLPYRLAVISAPDAAGFGDFLRHLTDNEYGFSYSVDLFEAVMQGRDAPASIADALACIECAPRRYDAVLLMRGGGSALDLACFDDYGLCFAIANCPVPVYTAIGHDKDFHIADMVAYAYVKTPTAMADLFIDSYAAEDERISDFSTRLRLAFASKISRLEAAVEMIASRIKAADPRSILARGYTLVTDANGVVVKSAGDICAGDRLKIMFEDGSVDAIAEMTARKKK